MGNLAKMPAHDVLADVVLNGDLSRLTPEQKVQHYNAVCNSVGLNPLTKPFDYMKLNGKELLYAKKDCSDQLRKIHDVTLNILDKGIEDELFVVTVRATMPSGRTDDDMGAVTIGNLRGEARANAMLKAITKAKRRVTLSICGLGWLDETEASDIPAAEAVKAAPQPLRQQPPMRITQKTMDATLDGDALPSDPAPSKPKRSMVDMFRVRIAQLPDIKAGANFLNTGTPAHDAFEALPGQEKAQVRDILNERMAVLNAEFEALESEIFDGPKDEPDEFAATLP